MTKIHVVQQARGFIAECVEKPPESEDGRDFLEENRQTEAQFNDCAELERFSFVAVKVAYSKCQSAILVPVAREYDGVAGAKRVHDRLQKERQKKKTKAHGQSRPVDHSLGTHLCARPSVHPADCGHR